ncbi:MAG: fasciclin domain-containing protein, partial [Phycisphaerales bacterium]|nr:fasciclin domain-containing protein [Phycisphaerales bacterium]
DGPFTVFAPSDDAFAKLPAGTVEKLLRPENKALLQSVLMYHVVEGKVMADKVVGLNKATTLTGQTVDITVQGGKVKIDDANVIKTDIACSNGVIHVIDTVIMPETANLVETALSAGQFGTLAAALEAANLVNALSAEGPFTVFAPTDAAFDKLPRGTVESLLKPENRDRLKAVLTYHVVPGRISSSEALSAQSAKTLQGGLVRITMKDGSLYVNDARVIANDIETSNGVIHVIDTVILPG